MSSFCAGRALSRGKRVATVLPMPVGACARRQRPETAERYTDSARSRCPARNSPCGKFSAPSASSSCARWLASCSAHARKRPQSSLKCSRKPSRVQASSSTTSFSVREVEVDERHFDPLQRVALAQHPGVGPGLCPVQGPMVGLDGFEVATKGLDFLDTPPRRVVAVGASAYVQPLVLRCECDLAVVAWASARLHHAMAGLAFLSARCGDEAQIEVAGLRGERAERLHRNRECWG